VEFLFTEPYKGNVNGQGQGPWREVQNQTQRVYYLRASSEMKNISVSLTNRSKRGDERKEEGKR
jgi:hypothetical protein